MKRKAGSIQIRRRNIKEKLCRDKDYEIFCCKTCDFATYYVASFKSHFTVMHGGAKEMFQCDKCKYIAPCEEYVKEHQKVAHVEVINICITKKSKIKKNAAHHEVVKTENTRKINARNKPKTKICLGVKKQLKNSAFGNKDFNYTNASIKNKETKMNAKSIPRVKRLNSQRRKENQKNSTKIKIAKSLKNDPSKSELRHNRLKLSSVCSKNQQTSFNKRTPNKFYKCEECPYSASARVFVEEHARAIHYKQKDFFCQVCNFITAWRSSLHQHMRRCHNLTKQEYYEKYKFVSTKPQFLRKIKSNTGTATKFLKYNDGEVSFKAQNEVKVIPLLSSPKDTFTSNKKKTSISTDTNEITFVENESEEMITPATSNCLAIIEDLDGSPLGYQTGKDDETPWRLLLQDEKEKCSKLEIQLQQKDVLLQENKELLQKEKATSFELSLSLQKEQENSRRLSQLLKEKDSLLENKIKMMDRIRNQINAFGTN